jgi:septal ring factor EnvC (AmiA/AmiB activator)
MEDLLMMTYLPIVISLCSLGFAIYSALSKNNKDETTAMTTVIVKLDSLQSDIRDIKSEINNMRDDQRRDHDALIRLDASIKSAWKQIDKLTGADREE